MASVTISTQFQSFRHFLEWSNYFTTGNGIQLAMAAFILLRAEPCLNQSICWALKVWSITIVSVEPSAWVSTHFRGCR